MRSSQKENSSVENAACAAILDLASRGKSKELNSQVGLDFSISKKLSESPLSIASYLRKHADEFLQVSINTEVMKQKIMLAEKHLEEERLVDFLISKGASVDFMRTYFGISNFLYTQRRKELGFGDGRDQSLRGQRLSVDDSYYIKGWYNAISRNTNELITEYIPKHAQRMMMEYTNSNGKDGQDMLAYVVTAISTNVEIRLVYSIVNDHKLDELNTNTRESIL